ncbi:MAG: SRPBCC family protein [Micropruina sp.]|nr:SRPBCC family protein [Micropruina sp.]
MARFEMSIVISRSIEEVFAVLADLTNDPKWRREWVEGRKTSQGPLWGARYLLVAPLLLWRLEAEYEVTQYEPNRVTAWKTVRGPLPLTFWRRVEQADGGARVTIGYGMELKGAAKVLAPLAKSAGQRALAGDFPKLKQLMEARAL